MFRCYRSRNSWWQLSRRKRKALIKSWNYYGSLYQTTYVRTYKKFIKDLNMTEWPECQQSIIVKS